MVTARIRRVLAALGVVFALLISTVRADPVEGRLALVIGEAAYTNMPPLKGCAVRRKWSPTGCGNSALMLRSGSMRQTAQ